ncbi:hypothetical protein LguiA_026969 [Lonicera macranthoides]
MNHNISKVLAKTDAFELVNHNELEHVSQFEIASLNRVQGFLIEHCNNVTEIVNRLKIGECSKTEELLIDHRSTAIILKLRKLVVYNMKNLVKICANLSLEWPALEKLKIHGCPNLKELPFGKENAVKLRKLILLDLPNLTTICACESFEWLALEKIKMHGCPSLTKLPFNGCNAKKMRYIEAEQRWWETLKWQDPKVEELLQPYCSLWKWLFVE